MIEQRGGHGRGRGRSSDPFSTLEVKVKFDLLCEFGVERMSQQDRAFRTALAGGLVVES